MVNQKDQLKSTYTEDLIQVIQIINAKGDEGELREITEKQGEE